MQNIQQRPIAHYSSVIICPEKLKIKNKWVSVLDVPFKAEFLARTAQDDTVSHITLREYESQGGFSFDRSADGRYIALFVELSDLSNENALFKGLLTTYGVTLGGKDFTQSAEGLAWLLTLSQYVTKFRPVSPLFKTEGEEAV